MKILFISPERPDTFWNLKHVLKCISKKAALPPLGLLTVAAMLPEKWEKKLVDMSVEKLTDKDILWADYVFIGAMYIQKDSLIQIAQRCKRLGVKTVGGGPIFRTNLEPIPGIDHVLYGEAENSIDQLIDDIENGCPKEFYSNETFPDLTKTPKPMLSLIKMKKYGSMAMQYSRGCPFGCDFCDVTELFGNKMRLKDSAQIIAELDDLYEMGWKGSIFMVDDNFIGNKAQLRNKLLPAMIEWSKAHNHPFNFNTQVSINVADDEQLMDMLSDAGFDTVFIGIESSSEDSLEECNKMQNTNRNLVECVRKIQRFGLQVQAGFILGFDSDQPSVFAKMAAFIQASGIATAMVGLLNAPKGTRLYKRLEAEDRIIEESTGDNTDYSLNFVPKMESGVLIDGYESVVKTIYDPKNYYKTVKALLENYKTPKQKPRQGLKEIRTMIKSGWKIGVLAKGRTYYWRLIFWSLFKCPEKLHLAIHHAIYGFHFRKVLAK